ncbi:MAG TPA: sigma-70 family RNA polymerase sigma factor [Chthonomonadaceae bacterium]|nr:sigma-70 family RNA polymerase sigma factor [Chthonomonadaceae bacterium]
MIMPFTGPKHTSDEEDATSSAAEFEALMRRNYSRAYSVAYRMMGNASDAEDLTQEAFVRVWSAFDRYDRSRPFEGWLFRILTNLAIDRWRRSAGAPACSLDAETSGNTSHHGRVASSNGGNRHTSLIACLADERTSVLPEPAYFRAEAGRSVRRALSALSRDYRTVIVLADVQGYSYEEIAQRVGCPVGTVRSRLHRGRQLLRQYFLKLQHQEEALDRQTQAERKEKQARTRVALDGSRERVSGRFPFESNYQQYQPAS